MNHLGILFSLSQRLDNDLLVSEESRHYDPWRHLNTALFGTSVWEFEKAYRKRAAVFKKESIPR